MLAVLSVEVRKLNRSLALLLALAAPTLIAIFVFFNMLRGDEPQPWEMYLQSSTAIWAFFMLPMSVTALTALVAQMEHGPRARGIIYGPCRWRGGSSMPPRRSAYWPSWLS